MKYSKYDKIKGEKAIQNVEAYEAGEIVGSYFCGKGVSTMIYTQVMNAKYSLVPSKDFDPYGYINRGEIGSCGRFKVNISSRKTKLLAMNSKDSGKTIILQYEANFENTSNCEDLPYFKISHIIDNSIIFNDSIVNEKSDRDVYEAEIRSKTKMFLVNKKKVSDLNDAISDLDQKIIEKNKQTEEMMKKKTMEEMKKQLKKDFESLKNDLTKYEEEIKNKKLKIKDTKILIDNQIEIQKNFKDKQKRLAFLIKDQLYKKIPQSLYEFIDVAFNLNNEFNNKTKSSSGYNNSAVLQNEKFTKFKELYSANKEKLEKLILDTLRD